VLPVSEPARQPAPPPTDKTVGNAFLADLSAYQPIYAVYGPGTDARLQISFKYKLFGSSAVGKGPADWRQGLHFAYTQRMLWDLSAASSPFHNIDFQPELIYITPSFVLNNGIALGGQVGLRHESNGRDGTASRSINSFYLAPMAAIPLGSGYRMTVSPRVSVYIGDKSDNPDIIRYRGNAGLFWEIGKDDGLRLSTTARLNFATGKGAFNADVSYPSPPAGRRAGLLPLSANLHRLWREPARLQPLYLARAYRSGAGPVGQALRPCGGQCPPFLHAKHRFCR
jgi:outer membrane phospholipase A